MTQDMITFSHQLYLLGVPALGIFERKGTPREAGDDVQDQASPYNVALLGLGRFGTALGMRLQEKGAHILGVDFNPAAVRRFDCHAGLRFLQYRRGIVFQRLSGRGRMQ